MCDVPSISDITQGFSDLFSGGGSDTVGAIGNGATVASDAAASNIAGAVPDAVGAGAPVDIAALAAPSASSIASSLDATGAGSAALGSLTASDIIGTGGGTGNFAFDIGNGGVGAAPSFASTAGGATPSFAPSNVGISGGGASAAALGAAPGGDLNTGGLSGLDLTPQTLGDQFGATSVPTQALQGKPDVPAGGGILDAIKGFVGQPKLSDLLGPAVAGTGLALSAGRSQSVPFTNELRGNAQSLNTAAAPLINSLQTGQLPAGLQTAIDEAVAAQKAHVRSNYASLGLSGSTMEQQALSEIDRAAEAQKFQQIQQLVQTGLQFTNSADQIYAQLGQEQLKNDALLGGAISNFASALGGRPVNPNQQQPAA